MSEVRSDSAPVVESPGRWDFLKKPITRFLGKELGLESKPHLEKRDYDYLGNKIEVGFVRFDGKENPGFDATQAAFLLTGFPMRADAKVTWGQPQMMANEFGMTTYEIDGRPKGAFNINSTALEVEGIRQFITEVEKSGVSEVTLFGHSLGATKAVDLAVSLEQNNSNLRVNLVLINPVGLYPKDFKQMAKNYIVDAPKVEKTTRSPNRAEQSTMAVLTDICKSIYKDIKATKLRYPKYFAELKQSLTEFNSNLSKVKSPVLIMLASEDPVVELNRVLPQEQLDQVTAASMDDETSRARVARIGKGREKYLKEHVLPNATDVKVIVATKYANHIGFGVERPRQTSHVISKFFNRLTRAPSPNPSARAA